jgi:hypothetical protein
MAKLTVNLSDGSIEIEGDEKFILTAFADVRTALKDLEGFQAFNPKPDPVAAKAPADAVPDETPSQKAKPANTKSAAGSKKPQPTLNPHLDLSALSDYVKHYKPKKNTERILVFAAFLRDKLSISPCSSDDIYSCFHSLRSEMKIPEAFQKNMNDTKSEGFIEYVKLSEVSIPIMGENQLVALSKKAAEA